MAQSILIIGAYGMAGRALSRAILTNLDCHLILSGRNRKKLDAFAEILASEYPDKHALCLQLDATHREPLINAMAKADFTIVTATIPDHIELIAECAIETNTNVIDIFIRNDVVDRLERFDPILIEKELAHFTQCGFHPGIIAPLIKYLAPYFDEYLSANVAMAMEPIFEKPKAIQELIFELFDSKPTVLKNGTWYEVDYSETLTVDFSPYFGTKICYPLYIQEISHLNHNLGLIEAGVYAAGFSNFIDYVVFPIAMILGKLNKKAAQKVGGYLIYAASRKYQDKQLRVELILKAHGVKDGKSRDVELHLSADDGYVLTAMPIISLLKQYAELGPKLIGLHLMGESLLENPLIEDLQNAGIDIEVSMTKTAKHFQEI